jgi:hypothetical protein
LDRWEANKEKTVPDPEMIQSMEEHQEVPKEDAIVKPAKGRKKWRRGQKSTAGQRGEPKELTRGNCGSQRKIAAACRKVSRHTTVAWQKRKLVRKKWTQVNSEFASRTPGRKER